MNSWLTRLRNQSVTSYLSLLLGGVLLVGIAGVLYVRREELVSLVHVKPGWFVMLVALQAVYLLFQSLAHHAVVRGFGINFQLGESYGLTVLNNVFNLFIPARGGALVRAGYMKSRHGLRVRDCVQGMTFMGCLGMLSLGAPGIVWSWVEGSSWWIRSVFVGVTLLGIVTWISPPFIRRLLHRWDRFDLDPRTWKQMSGPRVVGPVLMAYLGMAVIYGLRVHVALLAVGHPVAPSVSMFAGLVVMAVAALPVVPGSVGVHEAVMGSVMGLMGVPVSVVLAAALVERLSQLIFLVGPSIFYYVRLITPLDVPAENTSADSNVKSNSITNDSPHLVVRAKECFQWMC